MMIKFRLSEFPGLAVVCALFACVLLSAGCADVSRSDRSIASASSSPVTPELHSALTNDLQQKGGRVHFPSGLNPQEAADLWHLSEGSDIFPLRWFMHIRSASSPLKETTYLHEKLDQKFGAIAEDERFASSHSYPLKWVGLTASWSGEVPTKADVKLAPGRPISEIDEIRYLQNREASVAMVGVNCAFCHTGQVNLNGRNHLIEGGANTLYMRGFFQDLFGSTAKTMLTEDLLKDLLVELKTPGNADQLAKTFVKDFKTELGVNGIKEKVLGRITGIFEIGLFDAKKSAKIRQVFFERRDVVEKYLNRFFKLTYGVEPSAELKERMRWLSISLGSDPAIPLTPEGYSRTDAFGRISNWVARGDHPIPLTATVSVPVMWNIEYKAQFHWNANTNSVLMRNIGQSFGLGAILTKPNAKDDSKFDSTVNMHNLHKLESLVYKIQPPQWTEYVTELDLQKVVQGCNTYHAVCAKCHEPLKERQGPSKELIVRKVIPLDVVGTDPTYTINQATPVGGVPFKDALFSFTRKVQDRYFDRYQIPKSTQEEWANRSVRGKEIFRDTYLGEQSVVGIESYMNVANAPRPGYPAPSLASAWATSPYLHNGSVPTIYNLLQSEEKRPKMFFVGPSGYDANKLGRFTELSVAPVQKAEERDIAKLMFTKRLSPREAKALALCEANSTWCFDVTRTGNSNRGHSGRLFGTDLPESEKRALIEFLKVLRPEVEYSRNLKPIYSYDGESCRLTQ